MLIVSSEGADASMKMIDIYEKTIIIEYDGVEVQQTIFHCLVKGSISSSS